MTVVGLADLETERDGAWVTVTVTGLDVAVTGVSKGVVPVARALSAMEPWSMSAWVTA